MKLKPDIDIAAFTQAVGNCREQVFFDTPEGDHLNLRSALSQFVFAAAVGENLRGSIVCSEADLPRLLTFLEQE